MISDPELVLYACIAHHHLGSASTNPTILAEFNSVDSSLQNIAHKCLPLAPPHHLVYTHTYLNKTYTFLLEDNPFVYLGIFDSNVPKHEQMQLLCRLKEILHHLLKRNTNNHFTPYCFQSELNLTFHKLMSKSFDLDSLHLVPNGVYSFQTPPQPPPTCSSSKGKKILSVPLLSSARFSKVQKKRWFCGVGMSESKEGLVDGDIDSLGSDGGSEFKGREIVCRNDACLIDGGGRQRAKKIWRRHVWIVLTLDLAVCLILFGIWLFVCRGFQCIEG